MTANHKEIDFELDRMKKKILELEKSEQSHKAEVKELKKHCASQIPTNWLDPLLSDGKALTGKAGKWGCPDIESLLRAIKKQIENC